ncbi:MAG: Trk system potassium transporter TrkA [Calditrichia bacterium]
MNIILYGAGKTGQYLLRMLSAEGHDITIIDQDPAVCSKLSKNYDISIIQSSGIKKDVFTRERFEEVDLFIAVSTVDELNIMACSVAKNLGANRTIARIRNEDYEDLSHLVNLSNLGIDLIIHPEKEIIKELLNLIDFPRAIDVYEVLEGKLLVVSVIVTPESGLVGLSLIEAAQQYQFDDLRIVMVERGLEAFIPKGDYIIEENDKIFILAQRDRINEIFRVAGVQAEENINIMIHGSSKIAQGLAEVLDKRGQHNLKIIVDDENLAEDLSLKLSNSLVIHSEGMDIDILATEGIFEMDFFLALTEDDESNMVASLFANHLQVKKTITLIETTDFLPITKTIGLQRIVNRAIATLNAIMHFVRKERVVALNILKGTNIDLISIRVSGNSKYLNKPLASFRNKFPDQSIIGVIARNGEIIIPTGKNVLLPGDEIIVFSDKNNINKIEKMFGA